MADLIFNIAKGKAAYYAGLPGANDALLLVPLKAAGLGTDASLRDLDTLAQVLSNATEQTVMGRKVITNPTVTVDDTNDRTDCDFPDQTWTAATGDALGAVAVCYDPDTTSGTDDNIIPLTKHDFPVTPNGSDIVAQVSASGFYRAQ